MEGKDKIICGLSVLCLSSDIMQINERENTKLSATSGFNYCQRKQCHLKAVFKISGTGIYLVVGFEPKTCLLNNLWPVVHQTFITLG